MIDHVAIPVSNLEASRPDGHNIEAVCHRPS
jgi:hypothetical protein